MDELRIIKEEILIVPVKDLISYEICDVNPIRLREAAEGAGM